MSVSREPDIYETEGNQSKEVNFEDDRKSSSVEQIDSTFQSSFGKFKKKRLQAITTNFSDSVTRPSQYGFRTELDDYEMDGTPGITETLMQRYHRLKQEVADLISEVEKVKESEKELSGAVPADVVADLQQLQSNLGQLELDRVLTESSTLTGSGSAPYSVLFEELQAQLAAAKSTDNGDSNGPVYEVYANVEAAKFGHLSKLSDLEKRIAILEGLVGKADSKGSIVAAGLDADYRDLSSAVLGLQSKIALLDGSHVNSIQGQLVGLLRTLQNVKESSEEKENSEHKSKVAEALETVTAIAPLISVVPDVVNRMHTLKNLHEHASQLTNTISSVAGDQDRIAEQLSTLQSLLEQVQSTVGGSLETLQSNFSSLETRISGLQHK